MMGQRVVDLGHAVKAPAVGAVPCRALGHGGAQLGGVQARLAEVVLSTLQATAGSVESLVGTDYVVSPTPA